MSQMGDLLESRLDQHKYTMYELLKLAYSDMQVLGYSKCPDSLLTKIGNVLKDIEK